MESSIQRVFAGDGFESNETMKNSFLVIAEKGENEIVLWIAKEMRLFTSTDQLDSEEKKYAWSQYVESTRALDDIDERLGRVCLGWSTTDEIDHVLRGGYLVRDNRKTTL